MAADRMIGGEEPTKGTMSTAAPAAAYIASAAREPGQSGQPDHYGSQTSDMKAADRQHVRRPRAPERVHPPFIDPHGVTHHHALQDLVDRGHPGPRLRCLLGGARRRSNQPLTPPLCPWNDRPARFHAEDDPDPLVKQLLCLIEPGRRRAFRALRVPSDCEQGPLGKRPAWLWSAPAALLVPLRRRVRCGATSSTPSHPLRRTAVWRLRPARHRRLPEIVFTMAVAFCQPALSAPVL